jgi:ABC-type branched-subunit amino acid transport system ATPase component/ABC-type branched-subunit amino acid transport system permease subunit
VTVRAAVPPALADAWRHRLAGPAIRVGGGALLTWVIAEVAFGYRDHAQVGPVGIPTGIPAGIFLLGVVTGVLYGLVGAGIILVYRANRVISFAQAGLGGAPALLALLLVTNHHWPYAAAAAVMVVGSLLTGALVEVLILRKFLKQPRIITTVATIGVAQLLTLLEVKLPGWLTGGSIPPSNLPTPFAGVHVEIGGVVFNGNHLAVLVAGAAMVVALVAFFQRTRTGIAVRASAENPDRALLLGIPVARLSTLVWMIAGLCSGIAVFLRASTIGVPFGGVGLSPLVLLYGLAAATIAGMERMGVAIVAGMLVGVVEQASMFGTNRPDLGAGLMLPLILVALLPRWRAVSRAYDTAITGLRTLTEFRPIPVELRRLPEVRALRVLGAVLAAAVFLTAPLWVGADAIGFADFFVIFAIVAVSVVILSGWAGQISLGQWAFAGVGAAVAGGLAANHGQDFFVSVLAAGVAGAVMAVAIGLPALRIRGLYLAVVTLAFAATTQNILLDPAYTGWLLPHGSVDKPVLWSRLPTDTPMGFYFLCVGFLLLAYLSARSLRRSRSARVFVATRDNLRAAQSFGINSARTRLAAFAISGFISAVGGALFVYKAGSLSNQSFDLTTNLSVFILTVVGGMTSVGGAIAGAVVYEGLHYVAQTKGLAGLDTLGVATGALFVLTFTPGGLAQCGFAIRDALLRRIALRRALIVPSLLADRRADGNAAPPAVRRRGRRDRGDAAPHPAVAPGTLLACRDVDVAYDSVQVLFGVDADVRDGETVALLGTNGAGKSTLLRAVSGLTLPRGGRVLFDGTDITRMTPAQRVALGIVQVPGGRSIFPTLTVEEHMRIATWSVADRAGNDARRSEAMRMFPVLQERAGQLAGNLSGGEQQQLGLAMAFVGSPRLLIIDELSLGLAPAVVEQLLGAVRAMRDRGVTVLLVEQSVNVALNVAERAYFMEKGEVRFEGPTHELLQRDDIVRSVFLEGARGGVAPGAAGGGELQAAAEVVLSGRGVRLPRTVRNGSKDGAVEPVLAARDVSVSFGGIRAVGGVSVSVNPGEILGIIGPNGAGKTTLFDVLSGFVRPSTGRVLLHGRDVTDLSPDARAWLGLGRSFQDARIFPAMTVAENLATALERHLPVRDHAAAALCLPRVRQAEEDVAWAVSDLIELMSLQAYRDKFVRELSTGSRRIVDLAMVLAHDPDVLILDEPSSGIAQREAEALAPLLHHIRAQTGCALLVIEHDIPLVTAVSDRMVAMELGRVIAEGAPQQVIRDPRVVASYLGTDEATIKRSTAPSMAAVVLGEAVP